CRGRLHASPAGLRGWKPLGGTMLLDECVRPRHGASL
ncbi:uncharacterized protein METZ01_LOCUS411050, partial [marine metagenome]